MPGGNRYVIGVHVAVMDDDEEHARETVKALIEALSGIEEVAIISSIRAGEPVEEE